MDKVLPLVCLLLWSGSFTCSRVYRFQVYILVDFYMGVFPFTHLSITQTKISPQKLPSFSLVVNDTLPRVNNYYDFYHNRLVVCVLKLHMNGITQFVFFCVWPFSLNIIFLSFVHVIVCKSGVYVFLAKLYSVL